MIEFRDDDGSTTVVVEAGEKLKIWFTSTWEEEEALTHVRMFGF